MLPERQSRPADHGAADDQVGDRIETIVTPDHGPLRTKLQQAMAEQHCSMKDLTVLAAHRDPYRQDTPANHREAGWLPDTIADQGLGGQIHLRGLHYAIIGRRKPNGLAYTNTDDDWTWLQSGPAMSARWLDYVSFDSIRDQRNDPPIMSLAPEHDPTDQLTAGLDIEIPAVETIHPRVRIDGFHGTQAFRLALIGEKSSLEPILRPICERYGADLYLPTGEASSTMIHTMAARSANDGRKLAVLYFADCDPAGWQMLVSVGQKLRAFGDAHYPDLEFEVHRVALTPDQVREYGLPSTPLKATEKRANDWLGAMGVEQTEIDALAALQPRLLAEIAERAVRPFYDHTLDARARSARAGWERAAQARVDSELDERRRTEVYASLRGRLDQMRTEIEEINAALTIDPDMFDLPDIPAPPGARLGQTPQPIVDNAWSFVEQAQALIEQKRYRP